MNTGFRSDVGDVGGPRTAHVASGEGGRLLKIARPRPHLAHVDGVRGTTPTAHVPNPYRERIRQRRRAMGGQYRASTVADDGAVMRDEVAVAMARETALLVRGEVLCPF